MIPINTVLTTGSVVLRTFLPFAPGLYRKPMATSLPEVSEFEKKDWLAVPTLTELSLCCNGQNMTLKECICLVTMEKNIVQTALLGRDGTIKEYISDGDYQIEIAAALTSEQDDYPKDELKKLMTIIQSSDMIEVASDFLDLFNIHNIVVKNYGFNQETHSNRQTFTICCLSDTPYEIKLKND